ncbi:MAG: DUF4271 domain-containing protein [Bacteroidales bacterium]|nr:DUF4271 domain-containing protein [Bacteroidales bacterium]
MIQYDSLYIDTTDTFVETTKSDSPVFIGKELKEEINYPFSENVNPGLQPDWIFYFSIGIITLFAWIKLVYRQLTYDIIVSTVNYQLSLRLFKNANIAQKRISLVYSVFYFLNFSVYLFLIFEFFGFSPAGFNNLRLLFSIFGFIIAVYFLRMLIFTIIGQVFMQQKLFQEATFHNTLYNKLTGLVVLPFILLISYISSNYLVATIYLSLILLISINVLRLFRLTNFVIKNVISYFYFILYLCALEIIPILVIVKAIHSL